jgi:hypothetical protein
MSRSLDESDLETKMGVEVPAFAAKSAGTQDSCDSPIGKYFRFTMHSLMSFIMLGVDWCIKTIPQPVSS